MKSITYLAASIAALVLTGAAHATTYHVYITGSSAFRAPANASMQDNFGVPLAWSDATLTDAGGTGAGVYYGKADALLFKKTNYPSTGDITWVKSCFLGSAGGIQTVSGSLNVPFYSDTATGLKDRPDKSTIAAGDKVTHIPDIAFSDTLQATTPFNGVVNTNFGTLAVPNNVAVTHEDLDTAGAPQTEVVGLVTFKWVGSKNFPGTDDQYSFTPQLASGLFTNTNGKLPLSMITGDSADNTKLVFATGRNPDSGTRLTAFAECGIGVNTYVKQWKPSVTSGAVTSHALYPVELVNGISTQFAGNSGEASGSTVSSNMKATIPSTVYTVPAQGGLATTTAAYYVSYLGVNDANSVIGSGGRGFKWAGVPFSTTAVQQGEYTFWGYERVMFRADGIGTIVQTVAGNVKSTLTGYSAAVFSPGVREIDMKAVRDQDGGPVVSLLVF